MKIYIYTRNNDGHLLFFNTKFEGEYLKHDNLQYIGSFTVNLDQ